MASSRPPASFAARALGTNPTASNASAPNRRGRDHPSHSRPTSGFKNIPKDVQQKARELEFELAPELSAGSLDSPRGDNDGHDLSVEAVLVSAEADLKLPKASAERERERNDGKDVPNRPDGLRWSNTLIKTPSDEISLDLEQLAARIPSIAVGSSSIRRRYRMVSRVDSQADLMDAVYGLPGSEVNTPMINDKGVRQAGPYRHTHRQVSSVQLIAQSGPTMTQSMEREQGALQGQQGAGGVKGNKMLAISPRVSTFRRRMPYSYRTDVGPSQLYPGGPPVPSGGFKVMSHRGHHLRQLHRDVQKAMQGRIPKARNRSNNTITMHELMSVAMDVTEYWVLQKHHHPNQLRLQMKARKLRGKTARSTAAMEAKRNHINRMNKKPAPLQRKVLLSLTQLLDMFPLKFWELSTAEAIGYFNHTLRQGKNADQRQQMNSLAELLFGPELLLESGKLEFRYLDEICMKKVKKIKERSIAATMTSLRRGYLQLELGGGKGRSRLNEQGEEVWDDLSGKEPHNALLERLKMGIPTAHDKTMSAVAGLKIMLRDHRSRMGWSIQELESARRSAQKRIMEEQKLVKRGSMNGFNTSQKSEWSGTSKSHHRAMMGAASSLHSSIGGRDHHQNALDGHSDQFSMMGSTGAAPEQEEKLDLHQLFIRKVNAMATVAEAGRVASQQQVVVFADGTKAVPGLTKPSKAFGFKGSNQVRYDNGLDIEAEVSSEEEEDDEGSEDKLKLSSCDPATGSVSIGSSPVEKSSNRAHGSSEGDVGVPSTSFRSPLAMRLKSVWKDAPEAIQKILMHQGVEGAVLADRGAAVVPKFLLNIQARNEKQWRKQQRAGTLSVVLGRWKKKRKGGGAFESKHRRMSMSSEAEDNRKSLLDNFEEDAEGAVEALKNGHKFGGEESGMDSRVGRSRGPSRSGRLTRKDHLGYGNHEPRKFDWNNNKSEVMEVPSSSYWRSDSMPASVMRRKSMPGIPGDVSGGARGMGDEKEEGLGQTDDAGIRGGQAAGLSQKIVAAVGDRGRNLLRQKLLQVGSKHVAGIRSSRWVFEASNAERRLMKGLLLDCNLGLPPEVNAELADVRKEEEWFWEDVYSQWMPTPSEILHELKVQPGSTGLGSTVLLKSNPQLPFPQLDVLAHAASIEALKLRGPDEGMTSVEGGGYEAPVPFSAEHVEDDLDVIKQAAEALLEGPPSPRQQQQQQTQDVLIDSMKAKDEIMEPEVVNKSVFQMEAGPSKRNEPDVHSSCSSPMPKVRLGGHGVRIMELESSLEKEGSQPQDSSQHGHHHHHHQQQQQQQSLLAMTSTTGLTSTTMWSKGPASGSSQQAHFGQHPEIMVLVQSQSLTHSTAAEAVEAEATGSSPSLYLLETGRSRSPPFITSRDSRAPFRTVSRSQTTVKRLYHGGLQQEQAHYARRAYATSGHHPPYAALHVSAEDQFDRFIPLKTDRAAHIKMVAVSGPRFNSNGQPVAAASPSQSPFVNASSMLNDDESMTLSGVGGGSGMTLSGVGGGSGSAAPMTSPLRTVTTTASTALAARCSSSPGVPLKQTSMRRPGTASFSLSGPTSVHTSSAEQATRFTMAQQQQQQQQGSPSGRSLWNPDIDASLHRVAQNNGLTANTSLLLGLHETRGSVAAQIASHSPVRTQTLYRPNTAPEASTAQEVLLGDGSTSVGVDVPGQASGNIGSQGSKLPLAHALSDSGGRLGYEGDRSSASDLIACIRWSTLPPDAGRPKSSSAYHNKQSVGYGSARQLLANGSSKRSSILHRGAASSLSGPSPLDFQWRSQEVASRHLRPHTAAGIIRSSAASSGLPQGRQSMPSLPYSSAATAAASSYLPPDEGRAVQPNMMEVWHTLPTRPHTAGEVTPSLYGLMPASSSSGHHDHGRPKLSAGSRAAAAAGTPNNYNSPFSAYSVRQLQSAKPGQKASTAQTKVAWGSGSSVKTLSTAGFDYSPTATIALTATRPGSSGSGQRPHHTTASSASNFQTSPPSSISSLSLFPHPTLNPNDMLMPAIHEASTECVNTAADSEPVMTQETLPQSYRPHDTLSSHHGGSSSSRALPIGSSQGSTALSGTISAAEVSYNHSAISGGFTHNHHSATSRNHLVESGTAFAAGTESILQVKEAPRLTASATSSRASYHGGRSAGDYQSVSVSSQNGRAISNNRYAASVASASLTALAKNIGRGSQMTDDSLAALGLSHHNPNAVPAASQNAERLQHPAPPPSSSSARPTSSNNRQYHNVSSSSAAQEFMTLRRLPLADVILRF
ncbi:hypothetical protein CEUSTIGMA_g13118.t1 [Chlamydomonas eustigma]|uniref:Uncharacterized protein n=1 Tax=Chlamydomonas eustigma TaxID=1157962 RepID=A0A250XRM0_9CHLO|nr:hypothetical protein CEUSTIGMA_g13118.t1 [Chlamydomonas eustigma]|eukprot:GAX85704.1 hypothetical protein CEUSTIGMA_g13118.t1 [Chlamydomonas eustigma]